MIMGKSFKQISQTSLEKSLGKHRSLQRRLHVEADNTLQLKETMGLSSQQLIKIAMIIKSASNTSDTCEQPDLT